MVKRVIAATAAVLCICLMCRCSVSENKADITVSAERYDICYIIIDAGHGGFDGGAVASDGTIEKELNLEIALKLDAVLRAIGFKTVLVRNGDDSIDDSGSSTHSKKVSDMNNRLEFMKKYSNSIFVSIHMNKYSTSQPHGAQVFFSPCADSERLAVCIQSSVSKNVQTDNKRVVKKASKDIYLLYNAVVPAVIAECGFLSNPGDLGNLKDSEYQKKIAFSIATGIIDYFSGTGLSE